MNKKLLLIFLLLLPLGSGLMAQQPPTIKKSDKVETVDGKKFYIHTVEKGQTLYSIARTYSTTVDVVLSNNQDAVDGLKTGETLKIPFTASSEPIKKEPAKKEPDKKVVAGGKPAETVKTKPALEVKTGVPVALPAVKKDSAPPPLEIVQPIGDIHVALFLPLELASASLIDVAKVAEGDEKLTENTRTGIEFYEGFKLAFDSLRKEGFKGFVHVYDSEMDSLSFVKLMQSPELKEMDLIVGPLHGKRFDVVLKFAAANKINMVSPSLMGNNMLLGNPNVSKITPSYITQAEALANFVSEKHAGHNIIVINSANGRDKPYINTFKRTANQALMSQKQDSAKEVTFVTIKTAFSKSKPNIVIIPSTNPSFVTEAVNKLYLHKQESKDSLIVMGFSNFLETESLDFSYLKTLNTYISSNYFTDYQNPGTKSFVLKYRNEFRTEPTEHSFAGFDAGYYYLSGLHKYGNALQRKLPDLKQKGLQSEFDFFQADPASGYENRGVGIVKFEDYSWKRVK